MPALPQKPNASGDERNLVTVDENYVAPGFEDKLLKFWENNSRRVILVVAVAALVWLGLILRGHLAEQHDQDVAVAYGAANTVAGLKIFLAEHPDEPQAGLALLRIADDAYAAGNFVEARSNYEKAVAQLAKLPDNVGRPFAARARLGAAVAVLRAGQATEGVTALSKLAADVSLPKAIRAEAAFDTAVQAMTEGRSADANKLAQDAATMDPTGPWASRAQGLKAIHAGAAETAPAASVTPITPSTAPKVDALPAVTFPAPASGPAK